MEKAIKIIGTHGDPVKLYPTGYVGTKYGGHFKIKSVDFENKNILFYGEDDLDFYRISYGCPQNKHSDKEYIESTIQLLKNIDVIDGTVFRMQESDPVSLKIEKIINPTLKGEDYLFKLKIEGKTDLLIIDNFTNFTGTIVVESTPYTIEENIRKIVQKNTRYDDSIVDKNKLVEDLMELVNSL